ncbi:MAG: KH domain-containing protein [Thaumarchaeota archaeon]|nr:KH domain-containing protein [Nitrososphaerota archaeon]
MRFRQTVRVPSDRIGALLGKGGKTKKWLEETFKIRLIVDSNTGEVTIESLTDTLETDTLKAVEVVNAIARGFSQGRAARLKQDDTILSIMDLRSYQGKSSNSLTRVRGRIIGESGRARRVIEELTRAEVSVYGHTIAIIGRIDEVKLAEDALDILASGGPHRVAYQLLQKRRTEAKIERLKLWEDSNDRPS